MTVVHFPYTYFPDAAGGTEIYVEALCRHLCDRGIDARVAAPGGEDAYEHHGVPIQRYPLSSVSAASEIYGAGDSLGAGHVEALLADWSPDIVHMHAHTRGVSLRVAEVAKDRGIPVLLTYHTPTVSCMRGTLLRYGETVCDGIMERRRCASCVLHGHGLPKWAAAVLGHLPPSVGEALAGAGLDGEGWTAASMPHFVEKKHTATRALFATVDHIVPVCEWVQEVLQRNDVPGEKITVSRQGLPLPECESVADTRQSAPDAFHAERPLRLTFFGRLHPTKGVHVLLRALRQVPEAPVTLDLYGIAQDASEYTRTVRTLVAGDARVSLCNPVDADAVPATMRDYDAVTVPSQWLETGPLVVYEAFAAGRPVIGSDLGGIAELVTDRVDGLLVDPDNETAWQRALKRLVNEPSLLGRLRSGVQPPRTMQDAATDMAELYQRILSGGQHQIP